ncbi:MAG TPA: hypothetical protein VGI39_05200 [Polyangiaceae bacterium]|jgi:hypothetical protein
MAFTLTVRTPVVFVSWRGFNADDLRMVAEQIASVRHGARKPAIYVSRIPASSYVFSDAEQRMLQAFLLKILSDCASIHHVVEGDGFIRSARIATVNNLARATPRPRAFHTHATVEAASQVVKGLCGVEIDDLRPPPPGPPSERAGKAFREAGKIAEGPPPSWRR